MFRAGGHFFFVFFYLSPNVLFVKHVWKHSLDPGFKNGFSLKLSLLGSVSESPVPACCTLSVVRSPFNSRAWRVLTLRPHRLLCREGTAGDLCGSLWGHKVCWEDHKRQGGTRGREPESWVVSVQRDSDGWDVTEQSAGMYVCLKSVWQPLWWIKCAVFAP